MEKDKKNLRTCPEGHQYYKSSDCPVCPVCENERKTKDSGFLSLLYAPARRALENAGIFALEDLANWSENDLIKLHGMGPNSIPVLKKALKDKGLSFKKS